MPKYLPPAPPRLTDFAKSSCPLQGEGDEVMSMLSQPLQFISKKFVSEFEDLQNLLGSPI